jgi:hypothetical protein
VGAVAEERQLQQQSLAQAAAQQALVPAIKAAEKRIEEDEADQQREAREGK